LVATLAPAFAAEKQLLRVGQSSDKSEASSDLFGSDRLPARHRRRVGLS